MGMYLAISAGDVCGDSGIGPILDVIGVFITILKWAIPVALIIWGTLDLGKAVTEQDEKNIKKAYGKLGQRALAAVLVFFLPGIVVFLVNQFSGTSAQIGSGGAGECVRRVLGNPLFGG